MVILGTRATSEILQVNKKIGILKEKTTVSHIQKQQ